MRGVAGHTEVRRVTPPGAGGGHRHPVLGAVRAQPALLEAHQVAVDGDLVGNVIPGLGEGNHLLEELSQLDLQRLQITGHTRDLIRNIWLGKGPFNSTL